MAMVLDRRQILRDQKLQAESGDSGPVDPA